MGILAECPICHKKQAAKNRTCSCGENLISAKRSQRVRYWIRFSLNGKRHKEAVGFSIDEARDADGKRRVQKREHRIFDILPEGKMTFSELSAWYLDLAQVKALPTCKRVAGCLKNFNKAFGDRVVNTILPMDLGEYQAKRAADGRKPATIDYELSTVKTMMKRARENRMVSAELMELFGSVKRKLKKGANIRERTLNVKEFLKLAAAAPAHLRAILTVAYHTGMRRGELLRLRWTDIDRDKALIHLGAEATKEKRAKIVPLNHHAEKAISGLPRAIHHDRVFTYKGRPINVNLRRSLSAACKTAGFAYGERVPGGFRFHDLRGTFKTNMLRAGIDKALRDAILGHTLAGMDARYLKPTEDDLRDAMNRYTAWFDAEVGTLAASGPQNGPQEAKRG